MVSDKFSYNKPHGTRFWRKWYGTVRWQRLRASQLSKEPLCRYCMRLNLVVPAQVVDHIIPHKGNPALFWSGALQSLCKSCHDSLKQAEERGGIEPCGLDGLPIRHSHPYLEG